MFFFYITVFQGCKETDLNSYTKGQEVVNNGPFLIYLVNSPKYIHKKYFYKLKKYKVILKNDIEKRKRMFKKN